MPDKFFYEGYRDYVQGVDRDLDLYDMSEYTSYHQGRLAAQHDERMREYFKALPEDSWDDKNED